MTRTEDASSDVNARDCFQKLHDMRNELGDKDQGVLAFIRALCEDPTRASIRKR